ncbi:hypothetical protein DFJ74DRAFT_665761 [Hyaloraphidium curvatum]|nr:hypothetical protein DFJ74DRAFT_665761 [Hyaloraphidium curvatum]
MMAVPRLAQAPADEGVAADAAALADTRPPLAAVVGVELGAAITASAAMSPVVYVIDKAVVSNASGRMKLLECLRTEIAQLLTRPGIFFRSHGFRWIWTVYAGTYSAANVARAMCERYGRNWQFPTFVAGSAANMSLSILKDKTFARLYGTPGALPARVPAMTYLLFTARDLATVACSFNAPPVLADYMRHSDDGRIPAILKRDPDTSAQLLVPTLLQFFSTPVHLLALDYYNRQPAAENPVPFASRAGRVAAEYRVSTVARMARVGSSFGIGGVLNARLRAWGRRVGLGME